MNGRLPPEVIQYIVRQQYDWLRLCYETGLKAKPNLKGRVDMRFIIERDGTVSDVNNAGSDLPDPDAIACIVSVYRSMCFPPPVGGTITVVYPIQFTPC